jgi:hypothetical protein
VPTVNCSLTTTIVLKLILKHIFAGLLCTVGLAYLINKNWRLLQAAYTPPALLFLAYWWIAPESGEGYIAYSLTYQAVGYIVITFT